MKIRSRNLYNFLVEKGVFDKGEEAIKEAKTEYRRIYKRTWKKNIIVKKKELRPAFTPKEHNDLIIKSRLLGLSPTAYIQKLAIDALGQTTILPHREKLLKILQLVGISQNLIQNHRYSYPFSQADEYLKEAELLLLEYLKI